MIIQRTLLSTATVLILCLALGYPVAFYAARLTPRGRMIMLMAMMVPLMVSNVVRAYGWMAILGRRGVVSSTPTMIGIADRPEQYLYSFQAVTLGLLTILLPFMIVSLTNSLATIDKSYTEAALVSWRRAVAQLSARHAAAFKSRHHLRSDAGYLPDAQRLCNHRAAWAAHVTSCWSSLVFDNVTTFRWPRAAALSFVLLHHRSHHRGRSFR